MDKMMLYPIGVVAARAGLSVDVIRVWERRYGAVTPSRGDKGRRGYTDADIERLMLLARLTGGGHSIRDVAQLETGDLRALVQTEERAKWASAETSASVADGSAAVEEALGHVARLDAALLEATLRRALLRLGLLPFLESVIAPLLHRIGEEWHAGVLTVAHEHLATGVVQRVVGEANASFGGGAERPILLVGTPSGERHELGALGAAVAAAASGWQVVYLGADVPARDIADAAVRSGANAVALSVVAAPPAAMAAELEALRAALPGRVELLVGGRGAPAALAAGGSSGIIHVQRLPDLQAALSVARL